MGFSPEQEANQKSRISLGPRFSNKSTTGCSDVGPWRSFPTTPLRCLIPCTATRISACPLCLAGMAVDAVGPTARPASLPPCPEPPLSYPPAAPFSPILSPASSSPATPRRPRSLPVTLQRLKAKVNAGVLVEPAGSRDVERGGQIGARHGGGVHQRAGHAGG